MSDHFDDFAIEGYDDREHRARRRKRRGCMTAALVLLIVAGLAVGGGYWAYERIKAHFASAPDYPGPGSGTVVFEVKSGETVTDMGRELRKLHVVESVDSFISAANSNAAANSIQVGFYQLKHQMKSSEALDVLVNPRNLIQSAVTVPEGARVAQIIKAITSHTQIKRAAVIRALSHADQLGLPAAAKGNPEGYLFPATYSVPPNMTADELVRQMIAKTSSTLQQLGVAAKARRLGLDTEQVLTVASILEYEANRTQDYPKVARAIYNRLKDNMPLQSDATVSYASGVSGQIWTSNAQRANQSPYNTYLHTGLPPGPIGSPGETTIKAALNPTPGPWLFWVVVNLRTGKTVFSTTLAEHNKAVEQFRQYCQTSSAC